MGFGRICCPFFGAAITIASFSAVNGLPTVVVRKKYARTSELELSEAQEIAGLTGTTVTRCYIAEKVPSGNGVTASRISSG